MDASGGQDQMVLAIAHIVRELISIYDDKERKLTQRIVDNVCWPQWSIANTATQQCGV